MVPRTASSRVRVTAAQHAIEAAPELKWLNVPSAGVEYLMPLDWLPEHMPEAPVNIMDQYHPDTFADPRSARYRPQYAEIARRPTRAERLERVVVGLPAVQ